MLKFKNEEVKAMPVKISKKKHSPKVKFQVVLETLRGENKIVDVSRSYGINPNLISKWRKEFLEKGYLIFEQKSSQQEVEKKVEELQRIIGKKEVEIELLKKFLGNLDLA
jgi:transposase-like protein